MIKKNYRHIKLSISLVVLTGILLFSSCRKNRSMEATITVKLMADTMIVVPNIRVELSQQSVKIVGYTDNNGQFSHTFEQPVQLNIKAYNDTLSGIGVINIGTYGEDYYKSVFVY